VLNFRLQQQPFNWVIIIAVMMGPRIHINKIRGTLLGQIKRNITTKAIPNNISGLSKLFNSENIVRITFILEFNLLNALFHNSEKK
jgi:hypothetical protein